MNEEYIRFRDRRKENRLSMKQLVELVKTYLPLPFHTALDHCMQQIQKYGPYTLHYLNKGWHNETYSWQIACLITHRIPARLIRILWTRLDPVQRSICIRRHYLDIEFLHKIWIHLSPTQRQECYRCQDLSEHFIIKHWDEEPVYQAIICSCHPLKVDFMIQQWPNMPAMAKIQCIKQQNILQRINIEQLPMFLTDGSMWVRKAAMYHMEQQGGTNCE